MGNECAARLNGNVNSDLNLHPWEAESPTSNYRLAKQELKGGGSPIQPHWGGGSTKGGKTPPVHSLCLLAVSQGMDSGVEVGGWGTLGYLRQGQMQKEPCTNDNLSYYSALCIRSRKNRVRKHIR